MPFRSVIWIWSLVDRLLLFEDGVTLTRTEGRRESAWLPFPPSKYSINSDVCDLFNPRLCPPSLSLFLRLVDIVTGLPSSGNVYWLFCVTLDSSSVPPVVLSVSVGAGSGGPFRSTPILATQRSAAETRGRMGDGNGLLAKIVQRLREAGDQRLCPSQRNPQLKEAGRTSSTAQSECRIGVQSSRKCKENQWTRM